MQRKYYMPGPGPGVGGVGVIASSGHGITLTPQNIALQSEVMDGGSYANGWDNDGITVTADQKNDLIGNPTLDKMTITASGANRHRQVINGLTASHTYFISWEVALPASGAVTDLYYRVYNFSNFTDIIVPTSYFSSVSTSVARVTFSFTTPVGCTSVGIYTSSDTPSTGDYFAGRVWLYDGTGKSYVTTTTTPVP